MLPSQNMGRLLLIYVTFVLQYTNVCVPITAYLGVGS